MKIEQPLRVGEVADMFGITTQTIRNWIKLYGLGEFFSDGAKSTRHKQAFFSADDIRVVNTINVLTANGNRDWALVAEVLRSGKREELLPERAAVVAASTTPAVQLAMRAGSAEDRLAMALEALNDAQERLYEVEHTKNEEIKALMREIADLREVVGGLQREVELYATGRLRPPDAPTPT